jgi:hypothetical protein
VGPQVQVQVRLGLPQHSLLVALQHWPAGSLLLPCQRLEQQVQQQLLAQALLLMLLQGLAPGAKLGQEAAAAQAVLVVVLRLAAQAQQLLVVVVVVRLAPAMWGTWALAGMQAAAAAA